MVTTAASTGSAFECRTAYHILFTLKHLIYKVTEFKKETDVAFIDYVKTFDKVNREIFWTILQKKKKKKFQNLKFK